MNIIVSPIHIPLRDSFYCLNDIEHIQILQFFKKDSNKKCKRNIKTDTTNKKRLLFLSLWKTACYQLESLQDRYISGHIDFNIFPHNKKLRNKCLCIELCAHGIFIMNFIFIFVILKSCKFMCVYAHKRTGVFRDQKKCQIP